MDGMPEQEARIAAATQLTGINVPAIPRHYWRYRMHLSVEQLRGATGFNDQVSRMIAGAGRNSD